MFFFLYGHSTAHTRLHRQPWYARCHCLIPWHQRTDVEAVPHQLTLGFSHALVQSFFHQCLSNSEINKLSLIRTFSCVQVLIINVEHLHDQSFWSAVVIIIYSYLFTSVFNYAGYWLGWSVGFELVALSLAHLLSMVEGLNASSMKHDHPSPLLTVVNHHDWPPLWTTTISNH